MIEEIKPCPFCGNAPISGFVGDDDGGYWAIECRKCNGGSGVPFCGVHLDDQETALEAWNQRAETAQLKAELENVRAERDGLAKERDRWKRAAEGATAVMETVCEDARTAVVQITSERDTLKAENDSLKKRVEELDLLIDPCKNPEYLSAMERRIELLGKRDGITEGENEELAELEKTLDRLDPTGANQTAWFQREILAVMKPPVIDAARREG